MKRWLIITSVLVAVALVAILYWKRPWRLGPKPSFRADNPIMVIFSKREDGDVPTNGFPAELTTGADWGILTNDFPAEVTIHYFARTNSDAAACVRLIEVLRQGRQSREHMCLSYGELILSYADGASVKLGILPGHQADRYEFRFNHALYSLPRQDFINALQIMGVPEGKIPIIK